MRHVSLTCKNHPDLRWSCKEIAFTPGRGYNGSRNIFYQGHADWFVSEESAPPECSCPASALVLAPEDPAYGNEQVLQQTGF